MEEYRHAQRSQGLLSHGHRHPLFLRPGFPAGCFNLEVYITVFPQGLQKVLSKGSYSFIAGYLLQLVQVGNGVGADEHLGRKRASSVNPSYADSSCAGILFFSLPLDI